MLQGKTKKYSGDRNCSETNKNIFLKKYYLNKIKCDNMASSRTCYE